MFSFNESCVHANRVIGKIPVALGGIIIILGIFGNSLVIFTVSRQKDLKSSTFTILTVLAVADTIAIIWMSLDAWLHFLLEVSLKDRGVVACFIVPFGNKLSYAFAQWLLLVVSIERMTVIRFPTFFSPHRRLQIVRIATTVIFIVLASFYTVVSLFSAMHFTKRRCDDSEVAAVKTVDVMIRFIIPSIIITVVCLVLVRTLRRNSRRIEELGFSRDNPADRNILNSVRMILGVSIVQGFINICVSFVSVLKTTNITINISFCTRNNIFNIFRIMAMMNNAMNFYIYIVVNKRFRETFIDFFRRKRREDPTGNARQEEAVS